MPASTDIEPSEDPAPTDDRLERQETGVEGRMAPGPLAPAGRGSARLPESSTARYLSHFVTRTTCLDSSRMAQTT